MDVFGRRTSESKQPNKGGEGVIFGKSGRGGMGMDSSASNGRLRKGRGLR